MRILTVIITTILHPVIFGIIWHLCMTIICYTDTYTICWNNEIKLFLGFQFCKSKLIYFTLFHHSQKYHNNCLRTSCFWNEYVWTGRPFFLVFQPLVWPLKETNEINKTNKLYLNELKIKIDWEDEININFPLKTIIIIVHKNPPIVTIKSNKILSPIYRRQGGGGVIIIKDL